jgi:hypothetical protein
MAEVASIVEHEDGSATLTLDMTSEETSTLLSWALKEAINNAIKAEKEYTFSAVDKDQKNIVRYRQGSAQWIDDDHISVYALDHPKWGEGVIGTSTVLRVRATTFGGIYETRNSIYVPDQYIPRQTSTEDQD